MVGRLLAVLGTLQKCNAKMQRVNFGIFHNSLKLNTSQLLIFVSDLGATSYGFSNPPKIDSCSSIEGPILLPGKDRFLRQRCSAQFVSV